MPWKIPNDVPHENGHLHMVSTCKQEKKTPEQGDPGDMCSFGSKDLEQF